MAVGQTRVRLTAEFTDTVPTQQVFGYGEQVFGFGDYFYGFAYNDYKYVGGLRNLDRALGFSLDSDSSLRRCRPAGWVRTMSPGLSLITTR